MPAAIRVEHAFAEHEGSMNHHHRRPTCDASMESDICQKLIRLSFAKIVNSKHERGGAKLHRNLLILHLLQTARNEQRRTPSPEPKLSAAVENTAIDNVGSMRSDDDASLDNSSDVVGGPLEFSVQDDDSDFSLELEPLQLPFAVDAIVNEEIDEGNNEPRNETMVPELANEFDEFGQIDRDTEEPVESSTESAAASSSSSSSDDDDEEGERESARKRRKRRTSTPLGGAAFCGGLSAVVTVAAKKCCLEERHLSGLISVFNSGLSAVTGRSSPVTCSSPTTSSAGSGGDQQVPSLVRLACNPLVFK